jgi:hypothetical protein
MLASLGALLTIGLGLFGAIWPRRAASFVGISPLGGLGLSEIRATYGGLFLALGLACLYLQNPNAYFVAGSAWAGAALLRLPSLFIDKGSFPKAIGGALIELSIGLLLFTGAA